MHFIYDFVITTIHFLAKNVKNIIMKKIQLILRSLQVIIDCLPQPQFLFQNFVFVIVSEITTQVSSPAKKKHQSLSTDKTSETKKAVKVFNFINLEKL